MCSVNSTKDATSDATSHKKGSNTSMVMPSHSIMRATPPLPAHAPITTVPLGFAVQLRVLSDNQHHLESRINSLEHENSTLKSDLSAHIAAFKSHIAALESHNARLSSRRRETVAKFLTMQSLHQEAGDTFKLRSQDIQEEDVEGMLGVWAGSVHTVMNQHQKILGKMVKDGGLAVDGGGGEQQYGGGGGQQHGGGGGQQYGGGSRQQYGGGGWQQYGGGGGFEQQYGGVGWQQYGGGSRGGEQQYGGGGGGQQYGMQGQRQGQFVPQGPIAMRHHMGWRYHMAYNEAGYCRAHGVAYGCRTCGL